MIIGNGLMARAFAAMGDREDVCVFASGVSNSVSADQLQFDRERVLLENTLSKQRPDTLFTYFSTCSVEDLSVNERPYCKHKVAMEDIIKNRAQRYLIFRLSHIAGAGGNKHTIFNYIIDKVSSAERFELWAHAERNILDVRDVYTIVSELIEAGFVNQTVNIAHPQSHTMFSIVAAIEEHLGKKALYNLVDRGAALDISCPEMKAHYSGWDEINSPDYLSRLLNTYHRVEA